MNGEGAVNVDRGQWLYRLVLDCDNLTIYRGRRSGQALACAEVWRLVALLGVSDVFVLPVPGGWQPFVELEEGRQYWALAMRASSEEARGAAEHFLTTLGGAAASAAQLWVSSESNDGGVDGSSTALGPAAPAPDDGGAVAESLAGAKREREAKGWELVYRRDRVPRAV